MPNDTKTFTITDPRTFDGDPFDVAQRAAAQAVALTKLAHNSVKDAFVMARNAEMERQIIATRQPDPAAFENGPQGRKYAKVMEDMAYTIADLELLERAAGFNPKAPLGA